jgi:WD40 repeat protein
MADDPTSGPRKHYAVREDLATGNPSTSDEATERSPAWSPDGKSIAYTLDVRGVYQVSTKAPDSTDTAQLTHAAVDCTDPFWSPDGTTIYYSSHGDLWSVAASGGTSELVMEQASAPALHPDGKTLVFYRDGATRAGPLKGGTPRELSPAPQGPIDWMKFSPDGSRLALSSRGQLWILPWPSGTPHNIGRVSRGASWFPDSRHLLVTGGDFNNTLFVVDSTDGVPQDQSSDASEGNSAGVSTALRDAAAFNSFSSVPAHAGHLARGRVAPARLPSRASWARAAPLGLFAGARTFLADAAQARGSGGAANVEGNEGEAKRAFAPRRLSVPATPHPPHSRARAS